MCASSLCSAWGSGGHSRDTTQTAARTLQRCKEEAQQFQAEPGCPVEHEGAQQVTGQPGGCGVTVGCSGLQHVAGEGVQRPKSDFCREWRLFLRPDWELCHGLCWHHLLVGGLDGQSRTLSCPSQKVGDAEPPWLSAGSPRAAVKPCLNSEVGLVSHTPAC